MQRPDKEEYNPYFERYISLVKNGAFFQLLKDNTSGTVHFFRFSAMKKENYSYAESKWTPKQILQHIIDTERVLCYRALVAARGDKKTVLQNMDENEYAAAADVSERTMESLIDDFKAVRKASSSFFLSLNETETKSRATLDSTGEVYPITARAIGYIMIGHILHHINVIKEKYL